MVDRRHRSRSRADGTIAFTGFYGDYTVDVPGRTLSFELVKGRIAYDAALNGLRT